MKMDGFPFFKGVDPAAQREFQFAFHDEDELFALMLVGHRLVIVVGFDGHHEGPQVVVVGYLLNAFG